MPFRIGTLVGQRKLVLGEGAHWRHLLNTIKPSACGGDAAFYQIILTTGFLRGRPVGVEFAAGLSERSRQSVETLSIST